MQFLAFLCFLCANIPQTRTVFIGCSAQRVSSFRCAACACALRHSMQGIDTHAHATAGHVVARLEHVQPPDLGVQRLSCAVRNLPWRQPLCAHDQNPCWRRMFFIAKSPILLVTFTCACRNARFAGVHSLCSAGAPAPMRASRRLRSVKPAARFGMCARLASSTFSLVSLASQPLNAVGCLIWFC